MQPVLFSKIRFTSIRLMLLILLLLSMFGTLLLPKQSANSEQPIPLPLPPEGTAEVVVNTKPFEPAHFGIPDTIAGYKVLAVFTSENTACVPKGVTRLVLQASNATMDEFLTKAPLPDIYQAITQLGIPQVEPSFTGPGSTLQDIVLNIENWNQGMKDGCIVLHQVPTPLDEHK